MAVTFTNSDDWRISVVGTQGFPGPPGADGSIGPGLTFKGTINDVSELPDTPTIGDLYMLGGVQYVWDGDNWIVGADLTGPAGDTGSAGDTPLHIGDTPPDNTGWLWLDTSDGPTPEPEDSIDGGFYNTSDWDDSLDGGLFGTDIFDDVINGGNL